MNTFQKVSLACFTIIIGSILILNSCKKDVAIYNLATSAYPEKIGTILLKNCATAGCHNDISFNAAGGLSLTTWNNLFKGGSGGSVVIPFQHNFSTLFLFTNVHAELGLQSIPTMPPNQSSLSYDDIKTLKEWINNGAPDANGNLRFPDTKGRKKIYVTNQGCDLVSVLDAETQLVTKYVSVGADNNSIENPHQIKVSADGKYWYVVFINGNYIQKYSTETDKLVGQVYVGNSNQNQSALATGSWNTFTITKNGKYGFAADFNGGRLAVIDLNTMNVKKWYKGSSSNPLFNYPHATVLSPLEDTLYVLTQLGNTYYKVDLSEIDSPITLNTPTATPFNGMPNTANPHDVIYAPDGSKYFVSCQGTNEVRVYETYTHKLLASIATHEYPQELAVSAKKGLLFVTCMEDKSFLPAAKGCLDIIDMNSLQRIKTLVCSYQPHGVAVDELHDLVYVSNRNIDPNGIAPHHTSYCGGKNGKLSIIDLQKLTVKSYSPEVSIDPYYISLN